MLCSNERMRYTLPWGEIGYKPIREFCMIIDALI